MKITRGRVQTPHISVIHGPPGVGKTSFACGVEYPSVVASPSIVVLDYERGTSELDVARVRGAETWDESLSLVSEACIGSGEHREVVVDTIDRLEAQAAVAVIRAGKKGEKSLGDFGYGDGYEAMAQKFRELIAKLEQARDHGRSVWVVAHSQRVEINDPTMGKYGKYVPMLHKKCWAPLHQSADNILFANYDYGVVKDLLQVLETRSLYTMAGSGYEAKNRWGLPRQLPLSVRALHEARIAGQRTADEVRASIRSIAASDADLLAKAEERVKDRGDDVRALIAIERGVQAKLKEMKGTA